MNNKMEKNNTDYADITATDVTNSEKSFINGCKEEWGFDIKEDKWKCYEIEHPSFVNYGKIHVVKKILSNDNSKLVFVGMAGYSLKSGCNSVKIIDENISSFQGKYSSIYWLFHGDKMKGRTKAVYDADDKIKAENPNCTDNRVLYQNEIGMNKELAIIYDKIIRRIVGDREIHLIGKCAGGGVVIQILLLNYIYKALFLGVPSSPLDVQDLLTDRERFKSIKFRFAWQGEDPTPFKWVDFCRNHKSAYDATMVELGADDYQGEIYNGDKHEIPEELLTKLLN